MTDCNGCGACCDPVISVVSPHHLDDGTADEVVGVDEADWMRTHLTAILPRREGMAKVKSWSSGTSEYVVYGQLVLGLSWFYSCDLYDPETKRCTDWVNRPPMCRGFPWFDSQPDLNKNLPPTCSYRADIGEEVFLEMPTKLERAPAPWRTIDGREVK